MNCKEMQATDEKLTPKQERAILALLSEDTAKAAAEACGVNEATLWRWLQLPAFRARYREARRQAVEATFAHLQRSGERASKVLLEIAESADAPASARVAAARAIIEQGVRGVEVLDIVERIEALERLLPVGTSK